MRMQLTELMKQKDKKKAEVIRLNELVTAKNVKLGELITENRIQREDDLNMKSLVQMYENVLEKKRAKKRARNVAISDGHV